MHVHEQNSYFGWSAISEKDNQEDIGDKIRRDTRTEVDKALIDEAQV